MAWVLATSVTVPQFLDGSLIFTYVVIGLGFTLFFSGLVGWVGGASESPCLVGTFLFFIVLSMLAEVAGLICLTIMKFQVLLATFKNEYCCIFDNLKFCFSLRTF